MLRLSQYLSRGQSSLARHSTLKHPTLRLCGSPKYPAIQAHDGIWSNTEHIALGPHWLVGNVHGSVHLPCIQTRLSLQFLSLEHWWGRKQPGLVYGSPTVPDLHTHLYEPISLIHVAERWHGLSWHSSTSWHPDGVNLKPLAHLK